MHVLVERVSGIIDRIHKRGSWSRSSTNLIIGRGFIAFLSAMAEDERPMTRGIAKAAKRPLGGRVAIGCWVTEEYGVPIVVNCAVLSQGGRPKIAG
jgi:hypothetical protein